MDDDLQTAGPEDDPQDTPWILTPEEARVLGCLLEKAATTPEHYPLTMNALVAACGQKTNRDPVVDYHENQIEAAAAGLRLKSLALRVTLAGSRVPKFQHTLDHVFPDLDERGTALLTVLLLRGRQTLGELRARTERMHPFDSLDDVQAALDELVCFPPRQLVRELPSGDGHRVPTFVHLLAGEASDTPEPSSATSHPAAVPAADWRSEMEDSIAALKKEVDALRRDLDSFRGQFG